MAKLRDVAARAGVGMGTASRALSGRGYVDPDTKTRIEAAAAELGYRPNAVARALREQRTRVVGLVLPDLANEFYTEAAVVLQRVLADAEFDLIVSASGNDAEAEARGLRSLIERRVDGIIHVPIDPTRKLPDTVPLIQLNRHSMPLQVPAVVSDDAYGIAELTTMLLDSRHRDIAFIGGGPIHSTSAERLDAFRETVTAAGFAEGGRSNRRFRVCAAEFTSAWGRQALHDLSGDLPTAVVAASSRIALGVLHACRDLGIAVPGQLSLVAHGDPEWYDAFTPGISCYAPPLAEIGRVAADNILSLMRSDGSVTGNVEPPSVIRLRGEICPRGSVAVRDTPSG